MTVVLVVFLISLVSDSPEELLSDAYVPKWSLQQQHYQGSIQFPLILQCLQERNTHQSHIKLLSVQSVPPVVQFIIWKIKLLQHHIFFEISFERFECVLVCSPGPAVVNTPPAPHLVSAQSTELLSVVQSDHESWKWDQWERVQIIFVMFFFLNQLTNETLTRYPSVSITKVLLYCLLSWIIRCASFMMIM